MGSKDVALARRLEGHEWNVTSVEFHPNSNMLASGSWDRTIKIWDVAEGKVGGFFYFLFCLGRPAALGRAMHTTNPHTRNPVAGDAADPRQPAHGAHHVGAVASQRRAAGVDQRRLYDVPLGRRVVQEAAHAQGALQLGPLVLLCPRPYQGAPWVGGFFRPC